MGNEQQNKKQQENEQISIIVNHPNFTNVKLITENGQKIMQLNIGVELSEYEKWKQTLVKANLSSPTLLLPIRDEFDRKGFCSISGTLRLNFNNYSYLLAEQIKIRNSRNTKFEEWELWYLLLNLSTAQHYIKNKTGQKVGDIRPQNVFLNDRGDIQISNLYSWPRENTNYRKSFENQITYLAPEDMERLQKGIMEDSRNFSSEVFSIGLTVLSAAMLKDFQVLYDIKSFNFNKKEATSLLNEWKNNKFYSEIFTAVISNLCQFSPSKRLMEDQLWDWVSKYEKPINEKKDFIIHSAPSKIDQQFLEIRKFLIGNLNNLPPHTIKEIVQAKKPTNDQSYVSPYVSEIRGVPQNYVIQKQQQLGGQILSFSKQSLPVRQFYIENSKPNADINRPKFQGYQNKKATNTLQVQLAPQSLKKTDNISYLTPQFKNNYDNSPFIQLYLPRDKKQTNVEVLDSNTQKLNFFQDIIYPHRPWGGKIEQTIYIRRPESGYDHSIPEYK